MPVHPTRSIIAHSEPHFSDNWHDRCHSTDTGAARIIHRSQHLLRAGDPIEHPWLVVAGTFKSYLLYADGEEQVLDFHRPGDIIGVEAMVQESGHCSIVALDTCNVRALSVDVPDAHPTQTGSDTQKIIYGMYQTILRLTERLHMSVEPTDQRLASYLLEFSEAQRRRGLKPDAFRLPMRRRDLALYLSLATETLSRSFTRLSKSGLVAVDNHEIGIIDVEGLRALAGQPKNQNIPRCANG